MGMTTERRCGLAGALGIRGYGGSFGRKAHAIWPFGKFQLPRRLAEKNLPGHGTIAVEDLVDPPRRNADVPRKPILMDAERDQELFKTV